MTGRPADPGLDAALAALRRFHTGERWLDKEADAAWPRVEAELAPLREERDALAEAQQFPVETVMSWKRRAEAAEARCARLQQALGAYRSALRSGEPESERLRQMGDEALARPDTPAAHSLQEDVDAPREDWVRAHGDLTGDAKCDACGSPATRYDLDGQWCDVHDRTSACVDCGEIDCPGPRLPANGPDTPAASCEKCRHAAHEPGRCGANVGTGYHGPVLCRCGADTPADPDALHDYLDCTCDGEEGCAYCGGTPADSPCPECSTGKLGKLCDRHAEQARAVFGALRDQGSLRVLPADSQEDDWFIPEGDRQCGVVHKDARATCMKRRGHEGSHATPQGTWIDGPWCEYPADSQENKT